MTLRPSQLLVVAALLIALVLGANAVLAFRAVGEVRRNEMQLQRGHRAMRETERVLSLLKDAETGQRGFLLTGQRAFLEPFYASQQKIQPQIRELRALVSRSSEMQRHLARLETQALEGMAFFERTVSQPAAAAALDGVMVQGKARMDEVRSTVAEMIAQEETELARDEDRSVRRLKTLTGTIMAASSVGFVLLVALGVWITREQRLRRESDAERDRLVSATVSAVQARVQAEVTAVEWQRRFESAVRASGELLCDWDTVTNWTRFTNAEAVVGYTDEELNGDLMRWAELIHADDRPGFWNEVNEAALSKRGVTAEYRVRKKDGTYINLEHRGHFVSEDGDSRLKRMISFMADVTDRKQLELQFIQSQKMEAVGRLAGGIAHDFNNMLSVILGYSELLQADYTVQGRARDRVAAVHKAGERAAGLTSQLLAFSRQQVVSATVVSLNEIITNMQSMLARLLGEDCSIVTALQARQEVLGDRSQIEQIVMNLAVNARDAMPKGGRLALETSDTELSETYAASHAGVEPGNYVMLAISDTGTGMDAATQQRIFEPFFTTKGPGKGTGLGLSTVFGIVKQSHGHIFVHSEVGHGTTFKIYLPAERRAPEAVAEEAYGDRAQEGNETILVAEDEPENLELICEILEEQGYRVLRAGNGAEAVAAYEGFTAPVDMLITDTVMPGMGGRELAEALLARHPGMRVLFTSGYTSDVILRHGVAENQVEFLQKPFTAAALTSRVRSVLDRKT